MVGDFDINTLPLSSLSQKTRNLLSCLLDTPKIFPSEGAVKLRRDWLGLASLINIPAEVATSIKQLSAKTSKVLDIWIQRQDGTATVGQLLIYLQQLDRYDVHDDLIQDLKELGSNNVNLMKPANNVVITYTEPPPETSNIELITYDDRPDHLQQYHAFVLHANEDKEFVEEMMRRLRADGFNICTIDDLLPGHSTQYAPVAQLISQRCQRIILIYSPEFLLSFANSFYRDYAQALSIEKNQRKIIPIMYRQCTLPVHLTYYHNLYYNAEGRAMYDFWLKLRQSLDKARLPGLNGSQDVSMHSSLKIIEIKGNNEFNSQNDSALFLPSQHTRSISMSELETLQINGNDDSKSVSSVSQISHMSTGKKKKQGKLRKILDTLTGKKYKNAHAMVEN